MEIKQFWALLKRWWWLIILTGIIGGVSAFIVSQLRVPVYESSTTLLINQAPGALPSADDVIAGQRVAATYAELLHQRPVLEEVISNLNIDAEVEDLDENISIVQVRDTNLLVLTVRSEDPRLAANIANEIVSVFVEQNLQLQGSRYADSIANLEVELDRAQQNMADANAQIDALAGATIQEEIEERNRLQTLLTEYQRSYSLLIQSYEEVRLTEAQTTDVLSVVETAIPGKKVSSTTTITLLGTIAGITLGAGATMLIEYLRETISSVEEVEKILGVPTLGVIGIIQDTSKQGALITAKRPRSVIAEAFRVLRSNIEFAIGDTPFETLVVTSSSPLEGKTTTSANLATTMAQSGKRVILVDADLRRPTLHKVFKQNNTRGVTTALLHDSPGMVSGNVLQTGTPNLYLMPSGPLPPNPADILGSERMSLLVKELVEYADLVIFDTPPLLAVADASLLASVCDGTLLVVLADLTRMDLLKRSREQILQSGANLLGVILNRVTSSNRSEYYYY